MKVLALAFLLSFAPVEAPPPVPETPPVYAEKLDEGKDLLEAGKYYDAVRVLREADKLAEGRCLECSLSLANAFNKLGAYKDAAKHAAAALQLSSDPASRSTAYNEQGLALVALAGDDPQQLAEAEKAFRQVLELTGGKANAARFNLGYTLLRLSRDEEGVKILQEYLEQEPQAKRAEEARSLIKTPLRARKRLVPEFDLVTLDGSFLSSDDLHGKVVLLDFWGTWCPPCVAAVPTMRDWSRRMEKDPFVLVSVSTDSDEAALRQFIEKNRMQWPQVWDKQHDFAHKCQVTSFPTYILLSPEGEILYTASGWGSRIEQDLRTKIYAAVKAARKAPQSS